MPDITLNVTLDSVALVTVVEATQGPLIPHVYNLTGKVRDTGGAILCFVGLPFKSVEWRIIEGFGVVLPFTTYTDELGRASARFEAVGIAGRVIVGVAYVP